MKEKLKSLVTHNILLKLIALALAVLTWIAFYSGKDPIIPAYFEVPVEVRNIAEFKSQGHYIAIEGEDNLDDMKLEVCIQARTSIIEQLRSQDPASFIYAYVDVYELEDSKVERLMIHYENVCKDQSLRYEFYDLKNKSYYDVDVDNSVTKEIEVVYEISGTPEDGYMYLADDENIQLNPEVITLTGPSNQLNKIDYGKVTIRIAGANANVNKKGDIVLYDANGNVVKYSRDVVRASISEASVFVPIYMKKTVSVLPYLEGEVPSGYEYKNDVAVSQPKVEIYGPESMVNRINSIALPAVDLKDQTKDYQETIDLNKVLYDQYRGDVKVVDEEASTIELTFGVAKQESRSYEIATSRDWLSGNRNDWNVTFASNTLNLEVVGISENLEAFDPSKVVYSIRLQDSDFTAGKHSVEVSVTGLENVKLKEPLTVELVFSKVAEEGPVEQ